MNILYITQFFSATRGGGEVVFHSLAGWMRKYGHTVHVICHEMEVNEPLVDDLHVHRVKPVLAYKGGLPPSIRQNIEYMVNAFVKGSEVVRKNKIDIIHTNNFSPVIVGSILGRTHRIPVVTTIHDIFTTSSPDYWKSWASQNNVSRMSSLVGPLFEKITIKMPVDIIHTVSEATKRDILDFKVKPQIIRVIPNGIDTRSYEPKNEYQPFLVYIGRLVFYKNLEVVIHAFKDVVFRLPNAKLVVVGDGPMRAKWEKLTSELGLKNNIEFAGYLSQKAKLDLLGRCSALLFPSLFEGFGLVILEAFAMRKCVLTSDIQPFDEIIDDGKDGFILPAKDSAKWAAKMIHVLSDRSACEMMGRNGRLKADSKFNLNRVAEGVQNIYLELVKGENSVESIPR